MGAKEFELSMKVFVAKDPSTGKYASLGIKVRDGRITQDLTLVSDIREATSWGSIEEIPDEQRQLLVGYHLVRATMSIAKK